RPEHGPAVGDAEGDAGPGREGGGAGGPDRDAQASRGGGDGLARAAGGGQGERRAADVRDATAAADLRGGAGAAGERAPAAVEDCAAVLPLGRAGRGSAGAARNRGTDARPGGARVAGGAGIAVVAGQARRRVDAADRRVARVGRTHVALAGVALLAEVDDAVAAGLRDLPDDRGEQVR